MLDQLFRRKSVVQIEKEAAAGLAEEHASGNSLKRVLTVRDLTFMGIAAVVGAGIFSTIGTASYDGGPGILLLFIFISIACGFSAVCYAEFASMVPVSGSAYTYSYVAFGEIFAWIIGWDLLMEYAIGNVAVAISWSDYFTSLVNGILNRFHLSNIPDCFTMDYWTAKSNFGKISDMLKEGGSIKSILADNNVNETIKSGYKAWVNAPAIGNFRLICDIPAFLITVVITWIIYVGIKESKRSTNAMVVLKLIIIVVVLIAGAFYVQPANWHPFLPNGVSGVLSGTAAVFFAYIGFDAISTTAEECKNPQRDLPKGMFYSLIACTIIYVLVALVLTGMVSYKKLKVGDPMSFVFQQVHQDWLAGLIAVSAVIATASVLLVFQLGQPRIWMSMSRDGLLPPIFSRIHPKYKTPSFSTILTGFVVGIPALFMNLDEVVKLCSIGTLFAFVLVCGGIVVLDAKRKRSGKIDIPEGRFKTPYYNGKWIAPILLVAGLSLAVKYNDKNVVDFLHNRKITEAETFQKKWTPALNTSALSFMKNGDITDYALLKNGNLDLTSLGSNNYISLMRTLPISFTERYETGWLAFRFHFMMWLFLITMIIVAIATFIKDHSLIPILGLTTCTYLLCESGESNWERFLIWLVIGLILYFVYGFKNSKLRKQQELNDSIG